MHAVDLSCKTGKRRYRDFNTAAKLAKLQRRRQDWSRVVAYHCKACHGFHLGNPNDRYRHADLKRRKAMEQ